MFCQIMCSRSPSILTTLLDVQQILDKSNNVFSSCLEILKKRGLQPVILLKIKQKWMKRTMHTLKSIFFSHQNQLEKDIQVVLERLVFEVKGELRGNRDGSRQTKGDQAD